MRIVSCLIHIRGLVLFLIIEGKVEKVYSCNKELVCAKELWNVSCSEIFIFGVCEDESSLYSIDLDLRISSRGESL